MEEISKSQRMINPASYTFDSETAESQQRRNIGSYSFRADTDEPQSGDKIRTSETQQMRQRVFSSGPNYNFDEAYPEADSKLSEENLISYGNSGTYEEDTPKGSQKR